MDRIEAYTDFRRYLADFLEDRKRRSKAFSQRGFCRKAGFGSPSFLKEVVDGKRNLTDATIVQLVRAMDLTELDTAFFSELVRYNQSIDPAARQGHLDRMKGLRRKVVAKVISPDRHEYYTRWYLPVLRELATFREWPDDGEALARSIHPPIAASEAREGLSILQRLGFLRREGRRWVQQEPVISAGERPSSAVIREGNKGYARMGLESIEAIAPSRRDVSTLIVGVPRSAFPEIRKEIQEFKDRITRIAQDHPDCDQVLALNVQLFPLAGLDEDPP